MGLMWLALGAVALWALVRLGRQTEKARRGYWRISATILGAVLFSGSILAASRGAWLIAAGMAVAGLWLVLQSRIRPVNAKAKPTAAPSEDMSLSEARSILGVGVDADRAEIHSAWRRIMARAHPDQGGTEGLAARVNAARDRLMRD